MLSLGPLSSLDVRVLAPCVARLAWWNHAYRCLRARRDLLVFAVLLMVLLAMPPIFLFDARMS